MYGHLRGGLFWEKWCEGAIIRCGFEKVKCWGCLFVHKAEGLFLSVYVYDLRMAGRQEFLATMWKQLGTDLDLDPPVPLDGNVNLGCGQRGFIPSQRDILENSWMYKRILVNEVDRASERGEGPSGSNSELSIADMHSSPKRGAGTSSTASSKRKKPKKEGSLPTASTA